MIESSLDTIEEEEVGTPVAASTVAIEVTRVLSIFTTLSASNDLHLSPEEPDVKHVTVGDAFEFDLHIFSRFPTSVCGTGFQVISAPLLSEFSTSWEVVTDA